MTGIISDIHGNFSALKAVLSVLDEKGVNEIYCLGDVVGYFSQINECCNELRKRRVQCVMGNHDWYMVSGSFCPRSKSVNDCLRFQRKIITKENLDWLSSFPLFIKNDIGHMVHGGWTNPIDEYLVPDEEYFDKLPTGRYFSGHSHMQQLIKYKSNEYCNPGSIGQPRDGDCRASFAFFHEGEIELCKVNYDIETTCRLMEEAGFSSYYYGSLKDGSRYLHE